MQRLIFVLIALVATVSLFAFVGASEDPFELRENNDAVYLNSLRASQCESTEFQGNFNTFGTLERNDPDASCISVEKNGMTFTNAANGFQAPGGDIGNLLQSENDANDFNLALVSENSLSLELWFRPSFATESIPNGDHILAEIGNRNTIGSCGSGFGLRLGLRKESGDLFPFLRIQSGNSCPSNPVVSNSEVTMVSDGLYHLVVNFEGVTFASTIFDSAEFHLQRVTTSTDKQDVSGIQSVGSSVRTTESAFFTEWDDDWILHLGTSPESIETASASPKAFLGDIYHFAIYKGELDEDERNALFDSFMINSPPATTNFLLEDVEEDERFDIGEKLLTDGTYDFDNEEGDKGQNITVRIIELPGEGNLEIWESSTFLEEVNSLPFEFDPLSGTTLYYIAEPNESSAVPEDFDAVVYTSFKYELFDGQEESVNEGTVEISVKEVNDPPVAIDSTIPNPFATDTPQEGTILNPIRFFGGDIDTSFEFFGLKDMTIWAQLRPELGSIINCTTLDAIPLPFTFEFEETPETVEDVSAPNSDSILPIEICYEANAGVGDSSSTIVGTDEIIFSLRDLENEESENATSSIPISNALRAGCGSEQTSPCVSSIVQDESQNDQRLIVIRGLDSLNRDAEQRKFRLVNVPSSSRGRLYEAIVDYDEKTITRGANALSSGSEIAALTNDTWGFETLDATRGDGVLIFIPAEFYYNKICFSSGSQQQTRDAVFDSGGSNQAICNTGSERITFPPPNNNVIGGCSTTSTGCPVSFTYRMLVEDGPSTSLSPSSQLGNGRIWVLGVNNRANQIVVPEENQIRILRSRATLQDLNLDPLKIEKPGGDSGYIAVIVELVSTDKVTMAFPAMNEFLTLGTDSDVFPLIATNIESFETGGDQENEFGVVGLRSKVNIFLEQLEFSVVENTGTEEFEIRVYDPVRRNAEQTQIGEPVLIEQITLLLDEGPSTELNQTEVIIVVIGSAAALFVLIMCYGCWSSMIHRAIRGEKAAVWVVRNILCTHVTEPELNSTSKDKRLSTASLHGAVADAENAFEHSIHDAHARLGRVVMCAHLFSCLFPCCYKFDKNGHVPSEEDLLEAAVMEEREKIAQKHMPTEKPGKHIPHNEESDKSDVEEDEVADDSIFDWEKHIDPATGRPYYYNPVTNKSSWEPPAVKVHTKHHTHGESSKKNSKSANGNGHRYEPAPPPMPKDKKERVQYVDADDKGKYSKS